MRHERAQYKKKRRKLRWRGIFLILFLLVGGAGVHSYFQFKAGEAESIKDSGVQRETYEFNGKKDDTGTTNILLLGSDARGDEPSRADTIMIAHYNRDKGTYKLTSIMRDSYVTIPGKGKNKINTAFSGGPELVRQTIKENFDVDLQYYAIVDFQGFVRLIDAALPGGVEIDVEKRMSEYIDVTLEPGVQKLDGTHLLAYVRFRHDAVGDFGRVERQQKVMKEVGNQLASIQTIPKLPKLLGVVSPFINTNMDKTDMLFIGRGFLSEENRALDTIRIPVDGSFANQRVRGIGDVLAIDLDQNRTALNEFIAK
ncbi:LCP family protein [Bacillus sp. T33-2]|uniref:LCP family protein n=1 Tax=Bacillus sp. T33-2 TaxID=2054168 RepID=UPI000C772192|nr:LCP family protein [Bacillus sp. T33-2]PLR97695.1 transcriptional regulator [Bacillus sp. T33-2]